MLPIFHFKVERWKFNSEYDVWVSTYGKFRDAFKKNLPVYIGRGGYCYVNTNYGLIRAHRLVMFTWRPIANREAMTVDHLNHNKRDNSLENLEWVTLEENQTRAAADYKSDTETQDSLGNDEIIVNGLVLSIHDAVNMIHNHKSANGTKTKINNSLLEIKSQKDGIVHSVYGFQVMARQEEEEI